MPLEKQLIMLKAIIVKEVLRFSRIWIQTIFPPIITTVLYLVIFGQVIGPQLPLVDGYTFIEYIIPGLILLTVVTNSYANTVSSFYDEKFQRSIEEMLVAPVPYHIIVLGFTVGGVLRGLMVGALVAASTMFLVPLTIVDPFQTLAIVFLTAVVFSLGGLINGVFAKTFDDISMVPTFIIIPLTYLGGVFFSIDILPGIWRDLSLLNPIFYMINALRGGMLGVSDVEPWIAYVLIFVFITLLGCTCLVLLKRGIGVRT